MGSLAVLEDQRLGQALMHARQVMKELLGPIHELFLQGALIAFDTAVDLGTAWTPMA